MPNRDEVMGDSIVADPDWWADNGDELQERYALGWVNNIDPLEGMSSDIPSLFSFFDRKTCR